ncbi:MAG: hypothetical protein R3B93_05095 [Bacteroidia bacterium]
MRDYRPKEGSPVIDMGIDFPQGSSGYEDDYRGEWIACGLRPLILGLRSIFRYSIYFF